MNSKITTVTDQNIVLQYIIFRNIVRGEEYIYIYETVMSAYYGGRRDV